MFPKKSHNADKRNKLIQMLLGKLTAHYIIH